MALEPVTKIEVDSDDDDEEAKEPVASSSRKVVLNRDFGRQNSVSEQAEPPEKKRKSPSPDIVPIVPSTVTLCISDSDEDDNDKVDTTNEEVDTLKEVHDSAEAEPEVAEEPPPAAQNEQPDEDSDRDDVISLGDVDIIDLGNSDDDVGKEVWVKFRLICSTKWSFCFFQESDWNSRWLSSNKVSKVLTSAKLGKKLRDKVKEKKSNEKKEKKELLDKKRKEDEEKAEKKKAANKIINSKEEGTLEQFRILKELEGKSDRKGSK